LIVIESIRRQQYLSSVENLLISSNTFNKKPVIASIFDAEFISELVLGKERTDLKMI